MWNRILFVLGLMLVTITCSEPPNNDLQEEVSCEEATGTWLISKVRCNGETLEGAPFSAVTFDDSDIMNWKVGSADCQSSVNNVYQLKQSQLDIFGLSFFECSSNGEMKTSCAGTQTQCDSSVPGSLHSQEFPVCVISYGSLRLTRVLTEDHIENGFSFCPEVGQVEEIFYTPQKSNSAALEFSSGFGYAFENLLPGEFEQTIITITNRGGTNATNISVDLEPPFYFPTEYPGDGGSCAQTIPASSTCTIVVQFIPKEVNVYNQNVEFRFNNGSGSVSTFFLLSGIGEQPLGNVKLISGNPMNFGAQNAGTSTIIKAEFENIGTGFAKAFRISNPLPPFFISGGEFPGINGTCGKVIGSDQKCFVEYEFRPSGPGIFAGEVTYSFDTGVSVITGTIEIEGSAVSAGP